MKDRPINEPFAPLGLLMSALLAAAPANLAQAADAPAAITRLDEVRDRIAQAQQAVEDGSAKELGRTVQFPNFPNFRNFGPGGPGFAAPFNNFPNFNNFNNFPNFPNFVAPMWRNF